MQSGIKPEFNITDDGKLKVLSELMDIVMAMLAQEAGGGVEMNGGRALSGEDLIDFFSLAIAAVLDQDDHLKTPRDLRLAAETVAGHILRRLKAFRVETEATGAPWMLRQLNSETVRGVPTPASATNH